MAGKMNFQTLNFGIIVGWVENVVFVDQFKDFRLKAFELLLALARSIVSTP